MLVIIIMEQALLATEPSLQFLTVVFDLHFPGLKILKIIVMFSLGIFFLLRTVCFVHSLIMDGI